MKKNAEIEFLYSEEDNENLIDKNANSDSKVFKIIIFNFKNYYI